MTDIDMLATVKPKSDQLNYDDLIGGARTIKITKVTGSDNNDQPVNIYFEGDNNKPYKPCKSMRRVLINAWGDKSSAYVGRLMTIYGDPSIRFGSMEVGGIRISHMSHIDGEKKMVLTATKGSKKIFVVKPLVLKSTSPETQLEQKQAEKKDVNPDLEKKAKMVVNAIKAEETIEGLNVIFEKDFAPEMDFIKKENAKTFQYLVDLSETKRQEILSKSNNLMAG